MSTLTLSPSFVPTPGRSTGGSTGRSTGRAVASTSGGVVPVRLTQRGRVIVVLAFLAAALVLTTALGGWAAATHDSPSGDAVRVVTVQSGDTLYDIAGRIAAPGEVREMVHRIQELNSLPSVSLQVGEQIAVPRRS